VPGRLELLVASATNENQRRLSSRRYATRTINLASYPALKRRAKFMPMPRVENSRSHRLQLEWVTRRKPSGSPSATKMRNSNGGWLPIELSLTFLQFPAEGLMQQRLLQRLQCGEFASVNGFEALGFFGKLIECVYGATQVRQWQ